MKSLLCLAVISLQLFLTGCVTHSGKTSYSEVPINSPMVLTDSSADLETFPYVGQLYAGTLAPTGSMRPTLHDHDLILYTKDTSFGSIQVGDIILYRNTHDNKNDESLICHRVVYKTRSHLNTKGDNNLEIDPVRIRQKNIYGKLVGVIRGHGLPEPVTTTVALR